MTEIDRQIVLRLKRTKPKTTEELRRLNEQIEKQINDDDHDEN